ncbi:hypothetical protein PVAG01_07305 [Phlyctema vagabunda]|uniref:F-box domain-containing protein n=1 Tax=Phlyctema vagabunda TaxID=108571 RepID=A0ABR4PC40_9HELO
MPSKLRRRKRSHTPTQAVPNKKPRSSKRQVDTIDIRDDPKPTKAGKPRITLTISSKRNQRALARLPTRVDTIFRQQMPIEIHQMIAEYLPEDADVTSYASICKSSYASISASVWCKRYANTFDAVGNNTPEQIMKKYMFRRQVTLSQPIFDVVPHRRHLEAMGQMEDNSENQRWCLEMLKELILESDARMGYDEEGNVAVIGLNLQYIKELIDWKWPNANGRGHTDIMTRCPLAMSQGNLANADGILPLIMVIQSCLISFLLRPGTCDGTAVHFDDSQRQAYTCRIQEPLFKGIYKQHLNVHWVLNVANFFKLHLKARNEGLFYNVYHDLTPDQLPQHWLGKIKSGTQEFGSHWKGAYTFLDEDALVAMRSNARSEDPYMDEINDGHELLQDLTIFFDEDRFPSTKWPTQWQMFLRSDPFKGVPNTALEDTPTRRTRSRSIKDKTKPVTPVFKNFFGSGVDGKMSRFFGCLHSVPAQQGIHGFQRVTMMKFFPDDNGDYDENQVWAYEGCVLPGGRIILGRWWAVRDEIFGERIPLTGPFIFWNVESSDAEVRVTGNEAMEFLHSINDPLMMGDFQ